MKILDNEEPTIINVSKYDNNKESTSTLFLSQRALTSLFLQWCGWAWSSHCSRLGPGAVSAHCLSSCTLSGESSRLTSPGLPRLWSSAGQEEERHRINDGGKSRRSSTEAHLSRSRWTNIQAQVKRRPIGQWMDDWMGGWMIGWMAGWMDKSIDTWMDECSGGWMQIS